MYGELSAFDPTKDNISTKLERAELFMEVNNVEDAKKVSVLLMVIGPKNYGIIRSLCAPAHPKDKTYTELDMALKAHFEPKLLVIAEKFFGFIADTRTLLKLC